jgi:hypothetical protein
MRNITQNLFFVFVCNMPGVAIASGPGNSRLPLEISMIGSINASGFSF